MAELALGKAATPGRTHLRTSPLSFQIEPVGRTWRFLLYWRKEMRIFNLAPDVLTPSRVLSTVSVRLGIYLS